MVAGGGATVGDVGWGVFNLQAAACAGAPEPQHLPCFTQGLISSSAFSLMLRVSSTSGSSQLMSLLLLMWRLPVFLQSFWGRYQCSSTGRRKVRTNDLACNSWTWKMKIQYLNHPTFFYSANKHNIHFILSGGGHNNAPSQSGEIASCINVEVPVSQMKTV